MIRLPVTSISLSEDDLQSHFRQIDNYQSLLLQGFKKNEIIRFYNEQNAGQERDARSDRQSDRATADQVDASRFLDVAASCVELHARRPSLPLKSLSSTYKIEDATPKPSLRNSGWTADQESEGGVRLGIVPLLAQPTEDDVHSSSPVVSTNNPVRHAPRQSSLLRFARSAGSPQRSTQSEGSTAGVDELSLQHFLYSVDYIASPSSKARSYRPRTDTYSYISSVADTDDGLRATESLEHELAQLSLHQRGSQEDFWREVMQHRSRDGPGLPRTSSVGRPSTTRSSPLRAEADAFVPSTLPPPFSATPRVASNQDNLPSTVRNSSPDSLNFHILGYSSTSLRIRTPPRESSLGSVAFASAGQSEPTSQTDQPSSPPEQSSRASAQSYSSLLLPSLPAPTPPARRAQEPRTEPRQHRHRHLDGPAFTIYNDAVPSESQPQTPADLQRQPPVTGYNAAYTAPPGVIRSTHSARHTRPQLEPGEQSPTLRAIDMRERRHREMWRSVRVERERSARLRELDFEVWGRQAWNHSHSTRELVTDAWRDELDADRVGEENFGEEEGAGGGGGVLGMGRTNRRA